MGRSERVQLSGVFNVRKGKLALPVNRWSKRQITLSGTCLIVSSVKYAHTGKMHILPLIGGKVGDRFYQEHKSPWCLGVSYFESREPGFDAECVFHAVCNWGFLNVGKFIKTSQSNNFLLELAVNLL